MKYFVEIREIKTKKVIETILKTEYHFKACQVINEYNKEYGTYLQLSNKYPKNKYFISLRKQL